MSGKGHPWRRAGDGTITFEDSGHAYRVRPSGRGKAAVTLLVEGSTVAADRIDFHSDKDRRQFLAGADLNGRGDVVSAELIALAGIADADGNQEPERERQPSQATALVALATELGVELFHDDNGEPYATFPVGDHLETAPAKSKAFRDWLARCYYERHRSAPSSQALQDAQTVLRGRALYEGERRPVHVRLAEHDGRLYLDTGDDDWTVIEIRPGSYDVRAAADVPVRFRRPRGMLPLPVPDPDGSLVELLDFLNVDEPDAATLVLGWLLGIFLQRGGRAILEFTGEQGSAKTTQARVVRRLVDPCTVPLRTAPRDERDLVIAAANGAVVGFDNLSEVKDWFSDGLCRLSTGGGISGRELYTDTDEVVLDAQRPCLLTGINSVVTSSDLGDRTITITLPPIAPEKRRTEAELWAAFDEAHPRLLGGLLNAVAVALANRGAVDLPRKPRLADFVAWVEAAAPALGWEQGDFLAAFEASRRNVDAVAIEAMPIGPAVLRFVATLTDADGYQWQGTASDLLARLNADDKVSEAERKDRDWPKRPNRLSNQLRRIAPNLRQLGVWVGWGRGGDGGTRAIILTKNKDVLDRQDRQKGGAGGENPSTGAGFWPDDGFGGDRQGSSAQQRFPDDPDDSDDADDPDDDSPDFSGDDLFAAECCACGVSLPPGAGYLCGGCAEGQD